MSASQPAAATKTNEGFCSGDLQIANLRIAQIMEEKRQTAGWLLLQFCVISC
jgi:hypothetical protein